jgi:opine dehydrogenase
MDGEIMVVRLETVAVIGAGSAGYCAAADLTLRGFDVNLYEEPEMKERLDPVLWRGGIDLLAERYHTAGTHPTPWFDKIGFARIHKVTTNVQEAIRDAELIVLFVHAYRHERIAELLGKHLRDGQTILISNGMGGELVFARTLADMKIENDILLAGTASSIYGSRRGVEYGIGENQVMTPQTVLIGPNDKQASTNILCAFPAKNTSKAMQKVNHIWKCVPGDNVLQVDLSNINLVTHAALCILSATWIDASQGLFRMHLQAGQSASYAKVRDALIKERDAIYKRLEWVDPSKMVSGPQTSERPGFFLHLGPVDLMHQFLHEDIQVGDRLLASIADMIGVPTPTIKSFMHLASIINGIDYFNVGRTVEEVGISGMSIDEMNRFLVEGSK